MTWIAAFIAALSALEIAAILGAQYVRLMAARRACAPIRAVIASIPRLVSHPKIFIHPTPMSETLRFVDALLAAPGVEQSTLGPEWPALRQVCADKSIVVNDFPDAWLAAAVIDQGDHLVSFDLNFKRLLSRAQFTRLTA